MRQFTVQGQAFQSDLTDGDAATILWQGADAFGKSLAESFARHGRFTERQQAWAHKLAMEAKLGGPLPGLPLSSLIKIDLGADFTALVALFRTAEQRGLKFPKIRLDRFEPPICLALAGEKSKHPGSISVASGPYRHDSVWYGRIHADGQFQRGQDCSDAVIEILKRFAADPAGFAAEYGRTTGYCCFCHLPLSDERSTAVGYGPTCADKYHLPWGKRAKATDAVT